MASKAESSHAAASAPGRDAPTGEPRSHPRRADAPSLDGSVKTFVLDTNVLLHNPNALFVFQENNVVIPFTVIEELDSKKRHDDQVARNARECIRHLDRLREHGSLVEGVDWGHQSLRAGLPASSAPDGKTGVIQIIVGDHERPEALNTDSPDNRIIGVAWRLQHEGKPVVFISKDIAARVKADALGIQSEDFENQKVDADRLSTGYLQIDLPGQLIDDMYADRMLPIKSIAQYLQAETAEGTTYQREIIANEFVIMRDLEDEGHTGLGRRLAETEHLIPVTPPRKPVFGILARSVQQTMALDLLLDDEVRMVTLIGSAGTGKTLLALAAGMAKVFNDERYDKLLVARPIMPMGRDIGYLPGDKDEKLTAWMQPIFDNLEYLLSTRGAMTQTPDSHTMEQRIDKLFADGRLVLEPLTYIRGRSIPHQFMIVDEAQNLSPHEVKTIASRVGEGTKLILTGDIGQIDHPYLDSSSNGLSYVVERMKGIGLTGHVTLARSERSELASIAAARL